jgi:hypothetical protein
MKEPENINVGHVICFIYLYFAHVSDGDISKEEEDVIFLKLKTWMGGSTDYTFEVFKEAYEWYASGVYEENTAHVKYYSKNLKEMGGLSDEQISIICAELMEIANADGNISEEEMGLAIEISKDLGAIPNT